MLKLSEWLLNETYAEGGAKFEVELFGPEHGKLGSHATDGYAIHPERGHAGVEAGLPTKDYHQFNFSYDHKNEVWSAQANNTTLHNYLQDVEISGSRRKGFASHLEDMYGHGHQPSQRTRIKSNGQPETVKVQAGANAYNRMGSLHVDHVDVDMINKSYREVGKHYVKIKGHGLFHTGANPLKLPVQKFGLIKDPQRGFSLQTRDKKGRAAGKLTLPIKSDLKIDPRTKDIEGVRAVLASAGAKFGRTPMGTQSSHMQDLGYEGDSSHIQVF
jgi:hypothetical protein